MTVEISNSDVIANQCQELATLVILRHKQTNRPPGEATSEFNRSFWRERDSLKPHGKMETEGLSATIEKPIV